MDKYCNSKKIYISYIYKPSKALEIMKTEAIDVLHVKKVELFRSHWSLFTCRGRTLSPHPLLRRPVVLTKPERLFHWLSSPSAVIPPSPSVRDSNNYLPAQVTPHPLTETRNGGSWLVYKRGDSSEIWVTPSNAATQTQTLTGRTEMNLDRVIG